MVAINKRPVRLLCSPDPTRGSRSFFLPWPLLRNVVDCPSLSLPPSSSSSSSTATSFSAPEFPAVVISDPKRASCRRKYFTNTWKKEKSRGPPFSFSLLPSRPTPSSDRACQRHCRMQEGKGPSRREGSREEEKEEKEEEEKDRERHDGLCTFYEINSYVRHISGWLIVTALATEINSRD